MALSLAQKIAQLSPEEQVEMLKGMDPATLMWDWSFWGRPEQQFPEDDSWDVGLFLAGRGAGKTRSCAEWVRDKAKMNAGAPIRFLLVARTSADVRQTVVDGESGILNITPPSEMPDFKPSIRELHWPNGNIAVLRTADEPDGIRGTQAHYAWGDEIAAWRQQPDAAGMTAWGNLQFATRLGAHQGITPQIVASTTPKRVDLLYQLIDYNANPREGMPRVFITTGSTFDNAANLPASNLAAIRGQFDGTPLGAQEIYGQMLEAAEGALWDDELIRKSHTDGWPPELPLRIIGVDPSVAENPGDMCGIVAVGSTAHPDLYKRQAWVMEDASVKGSPEVWAKQVVRMARKYGCPVVAEVNQGGALVRNVIQSIDPTVKVLEVHARNGKQLRAEPVAMAYHQNRIHHIANAEGIADLETQMVSWIPGEGKSPDRLDALVHAVTALMIKPPMGYGSGRVKAKSMAARSLGVSRGTSRPIRFR